MAEILTAYLEEATRLPWGWGGHNGGKDCALWMADYVARVRGGDPGAAFRGRYHTRLGCEKLLRREGGLMSLVSRVAASIGLGERFDPISGDIGVIEAVVCGSATSLEPAAAICVGGGRWALFSHKGLIVGPTRHLKAWAV